jgi:cystathionine gamma-lyase
MHGFGGMISVDLDRDLAGTKPFLERTRLFTLAESLGGVESLIEHPALMTHGSIPPEKRARLAFRIRWCDCRPALRTPMTSSPI